MLMPAQPKTTVQKMRQSKNTVEDIITDDMQAPPPVQECPVPHRKPAAPATASLGTDAEGETDHLQTTTKLLLLPLPNLIDLCLSLLNLLAPHLCLLSAIQASHQAHRTLRKRGDDYLHDRTIQIISWGDDKMELHIKDPELLTLPLVMNVDDQTSVCIDDSPKFNHDLAEAKGLPSIRNNMNIPKALRRTLRVDPGGIFGTNEDPIGSKSCKAQANCDKCCRSEDNKPGPSRKKSHEDDADDHDIHTVQMSGVMQQQLMKFLALFEGK
ncbi:hypothetical protein DXG01_012397 [Tephrocybe rancida]|nr:hypothetical protein DXG01_012397 [Tephrocybe rancida]